jgi:WD40-like Beta Propeller Repeat
VKRCLIVGLTMAALLVGILDASAQETPVPHLPEPLSAPGTNESYHGTDADGRIWFTRADAQFNNSAVLTCEPDANACRDVRQAPFEPSNYDAGISFSADRKTLFFTSKRKNKGVTDEWNLWVSRADGKVWGPPEPLLSPLNTDKPECCAVISPDGSLYFSSERAGTWDIYVSPFRNGQFEEPQPLSRSVNSDGMEWPSWISPDGATLLFSSIRKGGLGGDDIYAACFVNGAWQAAKNLGPPVNTEAFEDSPRIEGEHLVFSSTRRTPAGDTSANVYRVKSPNLC